MLFTFEIDNDTNVKKIIKNFQKIVKKIHKRKFELGIKKEDKNIIGEVIIKGDNEKNKEIIKCIKAILINEKEKRIEYIYDQVCRDLDEEFEKIIIAILKMIFAKQKGIVRKKLRWDVAINLKIEF